MAQPSNPNNDPYPWMAIDYDGEVIRVHTAHVDGIDAEGEQWEGWVYAPRTREELDKAGF